MAGQVEGPAPRAKASRRLKIGIVLIALVAGITFAPTLTHGFVYDDHWTIVQNRSLLQPLSWLLRVSVTGEGTEHAVVDATRPAMIASMWLDRQLFSLRPFGYHVHSLLLYGAACVAAGFAAFYITRRRRVALVAGLLFAMHPAHAEVVAAVNYREDLIAGIGVLIALALLFTPHPSRKPVDRAAVAALAWLVGLFGKESAVALVPLAIGIIVVQRRSWHWVRARMVTLAAFGVVLGGWGTWRTWLRTSGRDDVPLALVDRTAFEKVLDTARYEVHSVVDALVPIDWSPEYAPAPTASPWWLVGFMLILVAVVWTARHRSTRIPSAGIAIAMLAPLPTSPLVGPINAYADRYLFLAALGGGLVWGWIADRVAARLAPTWRTPALAAALLPPLVYAQLAAAAWASDATLWLAATERAPTSPRAWTGLSRVRRLAGDLDGADASIERAIALDPNYLSARVTRVHNQLTRGDVRGARVGILEIERLGGRHRRGMNRARRCAALEPAQAPACVAGRPDP